MRAIVCSSHSAVGSSLNSSVGRDGEPRRDVEARRDDEAHRPVREAERRAQRPARLAEGQVERGALEGPAPVRLLAGHRRPAGREQVEAADPLGERVDRPRAGERQIERVAVVVLGRVRDVFAAALFSAAAQHDGRRDAVEAARHVELAPLRPVAVDLERSPASLA